MKKYFFVFIAIIGTALAVPVNAASPDIPPSLWMAKTAGTWKSGSEYGFYRVAVYRLAGEHASDTVEIQIIKAGSDGSAKEVVKTVPLESPGYQGYVQEILFTKINDQLMSISLDIEMKGMEGIVLREVYLVNPDGNVRNLVKAKYQDIYE